MSNPYELRFSWRDDLYGFSRNTEGFAIARPSAGGFLQLWVPSEARWDVPTKNVEPDPDRYYITLPRGTREALIAEFAPHADAGEVAALRDSLVVERRRTDETLARLLRTAVL